MRYALTQAAIIPIAITLNQLTTDPAHLPFAHHGVISKRSSGGHLDLVMEQPAVANQLNFHGNGGYLSKKFAFMKFLKDDPNMRVGFEPPSLLYYQVL
jgi:hypothetical protein